MQSKNWALFIESDKVQWAFGLEEGSNKSLSASKTNNLEPNEQNEFQKTTVNFIQSLQAMAVNCIVRELLA